MSNFPGRSIIIPLVCIFAITGAFTFKTKAFVSTHRPGRVDTSAQKPFALVELFTSEGCSSCPPADELLSRLSKELKGENVYLIAFHVDYWNRLGWVDAFSSPAFSERQRKYAAQLRTSSVYTPQAVVNGSSELIGSDDRKLRSEISRALKKKSEASLGIKQVAEMGSHLKAELFYKAGTAMLLNTALVQIQAVSHIGSGENQGRTIHHVNLVRELKTVSLEAGSGTRAVELELPAGTAKSQFKVIAFLQNPQSGHILAATVNDLN